jgi:hypothetical protein
MQVLKGAPWHTEFYAKAIETVSSTAGEKLFNFAREHGIDYSGWQAWFEQNHPALYKKYEAAIDKVNKLWGKMLPADMEEFKAAVKVEVDATQWAIDRYIEHLDRTLQGELTV